MPTNNASPSSSPKPAGYFNLKAKTLSKILQSIFGGGRDQKRKVDEKISADPLARGLRRLSGRPKEVNAKKINDGYKGGNGR